MGARPARETGHVMSKEVSGDIPTRYDAQAAIRFQTETAPWTHIPHANICRALNHERGVVGGTRRENKPPRWRSGSQERGC